MENSLKNHIYKYRFLLLAVLIKIIGAVTFSGFSYYKIIFSMPARLIEQVYALTICISESYFLIDVLLDYFQMENEIKVRINKNRLYRIYFKKTCLAFGTIVLIQLFLGYFQPLTSQTVFFIFLYYLLTVFAFWKLTTFFGRKQETILLFSHVACEAVIRVCFAAIM